MDLNTDNEKKWRYFLSTIKSYKQGKSNSITIKKKRNENCLATEFANKLLEKSGGIVQFTGTKDVLSRYKHLDVRNETFTPKSREQIKEIQLGKAETWPKAANNKMCIASTTEKEVMELSDEDNSESLLGSNKEHVQKQDNLDKVFDNENSSSILTKDVSSGHKHVDVSNETFTPQSRESIKEIQLVKSETWPKAANNEMCLASTTKKVMELSDEDNSERLLGSDKERVQKQENLDKVFDNENSSSILTKDVLSRHKKLPRLENLNDKDIGETPNFIQMSVENVCHVEGNIEIQRVRDRDKLIQSVKNDIDKPCSKWNISSIAEYFIFDKCVTRLEVPHNCSLYLDATYELVQKDIIKRLEVLKGNPLKKGKGNRDTELLTQLKSISNTETGCRIILDALLIPVCSALGVEIEVDKNINCIFLPNCRFDYCIIKDNQIIGCVEAKSIQSLNDSSVAQALLQLTILQTALIVNGAQSDFPVFAIVTDGHRFIYMQLKGSSLGFEHENGKVIVREVTRECDFKSIMQHITFLINGAEQNADDIITID